MRKTLNTGVAVMLYILLVALLMTACQPTPEEPVVINKAGNDMQKIIDSTPVPVSEQTPDTQNAEITYKTLGHWEDSFSAGSAYRSCP